MGLSMLRLGVVGCGQISQLAHLPAIRMSEEVELVALCDRRRNLLDAVAERYGVARVFADPEDLFADADVEAVILCVPTMEHHLLAIKALEAGKHVLVEKPMATSVARAEQMLAAAASSSGRLMVGHHKRYDLGCELARERLQTGELGTAQLVTYHWSCGDWTAMSPNLPIATDEPAPAWQYEYPQDIEAPSARRFYERQLEMFTHMTNLIRWLLGGDIRGVIHALEGAPTTGQLRGAVMYSHGELVSQCIEGPHYVTQPVWHERMEVWCENGRVRVDLPPNIQVNKPADVAIWRADAGVEERLQVPWSWAFKRQLDHFACCVQSGEPFRTEGKDAIKDVVLAEQAARLVTGWP